MLRILCLFAVVAVAAASTRAEPYVGYIYPAGIARGTTNVFLVGGQGFAAGTRAELAGKGIRVVADERVPSSAPPTGSQRAWMRSWLIRIENGITNAPPMPTNETAHVDEWTSNRWWKALNTLTPIKRSLVMRDVFLPKNPLQAAPSLRQMRLVTVAADRDAALGAHPLVVTGPNGGASAPRPLIVTDAPHAIEPRMVPQSWWKNLTNGTVVAERSTVHEVGGGLILDGRVMPGETDSFRVRLTAGEWRVVACAARLQPIIGDAVPGYFKATVEATDDGGAPLARSDETVRGGHDPAFTFVVPQDGVVEISVHDALYRGREDFVYSLALSPAGTTNPLDDFASDDPYAIKLDECGNVEGGGVRGNAPFTIYAKRSAFATKPGWRVTIPLVVCRRNGFDGPITILDNPYLAPATTAVIPAGTNAWSFVAFGKRHPAGGLKPFRIYAACVTGDGKVIGSEVVPADEYEQAFAWKHLLEAKTFLYRPLPPDPPKKKNDQQKKK